MVVEKLIRWLKPQRLVHTAFRLRPASEFIIFQGQRLTRRQVFSRVEQLAAGLQALGVKKGDRVATLLPACPEAVYSIFLPSVLGAVIVPLNPFLGEHELRHILADCGARVVITTRNWYGQDYPRMLANLLPDLPDLDYVLVRDASDGDGRAFLPLSQVMSPGKPLRRTALSGSDPIIIFYTSGTTGRPKGALHTHGGMWGILVRSAGARLTVKEVLNFCRGQIAPFKIPERIRFVERLPTTATNKVQKFKLREMAAQESSPDAAS